MTVNFSTKVGMATTIVAAALTAGAIVGAVMISATAATVALSVAALALGIFTLISAVGTWTKSFADDKNASLCSILKDGAGFFIEMFKACLCCCNKKQKV